MGASIAFLASNNANVGQHQAVEIAPSSLSETAVPDDVAQTAVEAVGDTPVVSQCGFDNDGIGWVKCPKPQRIMASQASAEQKIKYRHLLQQIFAVETIVGRRVCFDPNDLIEICHGVVKYFKSEPMLIEGIPGPITVVGDLHGQLHDLDRIFKFHAKNGKPGYECAKFIFLGDYVDRGRQSLEVITALFILKILYPGEFILLRGNHEFPNINDTNGFAGEVDDRFNAKAAQTVYHMFNGSFMLMSVCAILGNKAFCAHGGISTSGFTLRRLRNLRKPLVLAADNAIVNDLVWSDPAEGLQGTAYNASRQASFYFGEDVFAACMDAVGCVMMFRGHTVIDEGCSVTWDRLFTVFSASDSGLQGNKGAFAMLAEDMSVRVFTMQVVGSGRRTTGASFYFGEDVFAACMDAVGCVMMFRGHTVIDEGCSVTWDRLFTVFSASDSGLQGNKGAFAMLAEDMSVRVFIMQVDPARHDLELRLKGPISDEVTVCDDVPKNIARMKN